jgi:hypothetical protein
MPKRKKISPRKSKPDKYFFIVEGCTEENYIRRLKELYPHHQVDKPRNYKGGSAKAVLEEAKRLIAKHGDDYLGYIVWFDKDTYFPQDKNLKNSLQSQNNVEIYMSEPCIEHWLLAHFQPINLSSENQCKFYENILRKYIPNYDKNDGFQLKKYLYSKDVEYAINCYPKIGEIPKVYFING